MKNVRRSGYFYIFFHIKKLMLIVEKQRRIHSGFHGLLAGSKLNGVDMIEEMTGKCQKYFVNPVFSSSLTRTTPKYFCINY